MTAPGSALRRPQTWATVILLVALATLLPRIASPTSVVIAVLGAASLLIVAHSAGLSMSELGIARADLGRGARWAAVIIAIVSVGYVILALIPATRSVVFGDNRVPTSTSAILVQVFVVIPLQTVLLEEVAFRGVLWGLVRHHHRALTATIWSSLLFGLWHVLPALGFAGARTDVAGEVGTEGIVLGTVVLTMLAGVVLCELRRRSGSLLAPMGLHWATNAIGLLAAAAVAGHL